MRFSFGSSRRRDSRRDSSSASLPSSIGAPVEKPSKNRKNSDSTTPRTLDSSSAFTSSPGDARRESLEDSGYWKDYMATLTPDRQAQLAETLYSHVLAIEGRDVAIGLLEGHDKSALAPLAETHFHRGCELWAQEDFSYALSQLEISKSIWERCDPHLIYLLQRETVSRSDDSGNDHDRQQNNTELIAQLHYAMGTVHLGMKNCREALKGFRRAFQVTALCLGVDHDLFGAILYMMRMTLLTMGYSSPKIHDYIQRYRREIKKERDADRYAADGNRPRALKKYRDLSFLREGDWQAKVRVKKKIATLHEEGGNLLKAAKERSSISAIYRRVASLDPETPLLRVARKKEMSLFNVLDRNEI